ncbi:M13-type metalloendopeptidase [Mycoplasmopsis sturni]|uniref:M13-type metalloendopeptidase n=1 Tax=Mycoplasmopsis sturni TaxID=39047 RepID=UPI00056424BF|nr:M13 family metallopeptidase [Mycoplasmopsis sturni]
MKQKSLLKDDFFAHINSEWLKNTKIPSDRASISSFGELDKKLEKELIKMANELTQREHLPQIDGLKAFAKFYKMAKNYRQRNKLGFEPIRSLINEIEQLQSFEQLSQIFVAKRSGWAYLPFTLEVEEDFEDNTIKVLWAGEPGTILPSKEYYAKEDAAKLLNIFRQMSFDLLTMYGYSQTQANQMVESAISFDNHLKDFVLSAQDKADYTSLYNVVRFDQIKGSKELFDLEKLAREVVKQDIETIVLTNPEFFEKLDKIYNSETFNGYKSLLIICNLLNYAPYLSNEIRLKAGELSRAISGVAKPVSASKAAFKLSQKWFAMPLGMYYAEKHFGKEAKADVEKMIFNMIKIYKQRLSTNTWLSKETIAKAIAKLEKLDVMVGYPNQLRPFYKKYQVIPYTQKSNLVDNVLRFQDILQEYRDSLYLKHESSQYWQMSPAMINAYFHPIKNHIVFPAAILQAPMYDKNQSSSVNYGGIGAVIAHEISHAFDNNGSQFDENGTLNNWWTDADREKFAEKTQAVIELFDGFPTEAGPVNGKLTVSENIADLGGFLCALEAAQLEPDFNAEDFFANWARIWRTKAKPEYQKLLLNTDVHAPAKARANVQLQNCDLFQEYYQITPEDKMYLPKEKRVKIW